MPKITTVFTSRSGKTHPTLDKATTEDLADLFGNPAIGADIFEKRHAIADILAEHEVIVQSGRNISDL